MREHATVVPPARAALECLRGARGSDRLAREPMNPHEPGEDTPDLLAVARLRILKECLATRLRACRRVRVWECLHTWWWPWPSKPPCFPFLCRRKLNSINAFRRRGSERA